MSTVLALVAVALTGVSLLLAGTSILAATRTHATRFWFAAAAFLLIAARGALVIGDGQGWLTSPMAWDGWTVGTDAVLVAALYLAIAKG